MNETRKRLMSSEATNELGLGWAICHSNEGFESSLKLGEIYVAKMNRYGTGVYIYDKGRWIHWSKDEFEMLDETSAEMLKDALPVKDLVIVRCHKDKIPK